MLSPHLSSIAVLLKKSHPNIILVQEISLAQAKAYLIQNLQLTKMAMGATRLAQLQEISGKVPACLERPMAQLLAWLIMLTWQCTKSLSLSVLKVMFWLQWMLWLMMEWTCYPSQLAVPQFLCMRM
ncbi:hypothetical protein C1H46_001793 [Malus baccata]|uniref:Uncharacterized protein n=1 Tax=Malus baccata TaxID=106549 RepID=A0A540NNJ4_MALBA|nr:hypothetical protein C1H46_001793 [Malus baccata]